MHVSWRSDGGLVLFPEPSQVHDAALAIARIAGERLLWFCVVDNHVHLVLGASTPELPQLLRRLRLALLAIRADLQLPRPHLKPFDGVAHVENLIEYVLRNPEHHGMEGHPALHPGNSTAALAGCLLLPGFRSEAWKAYLPRWQLRDVMRDAGVPEEALGEASLDRVRELGAEAVARAAAAMACRPTLGRNDPTSVAARCAVIDVCSRAGIPTREIEGVIGRSPRTVRASKARADRAELSSMLLRRLHFEDVLRTRPLVPRKRDRLA